MNTSWAQLFLKGLPKNLTSKKSVSRGWNLLPKARCHFSLGVSECDSGLHSQPLPLSTFRNPQQHQDTFRKKQVSNVGFKVLIGLFAYIGACTPLYHVNSRLIEQAANGLGKPLQLQHKPVFQACQRVHSSAAGLLLFFAVYWHPTFSYYCCTHEFYA